MGAIAITGATLTWGTIVQALQGPVRVRVAKAARRRLARSRAVVEAHLADPEPTYGVNTGFGIFARTRIDAEHLAELQHNLVLSHSAGVGTPLPDGVVRLMLLLKLHGLCLGYSGVRPALADALAAWLNADCLPVVPSQGSVGASGDLAPLAHMTLALLGQGTVRCQGKTLAARTAVRRHRLPHVTLAPKEGLGLLNGTQAMLAVGVAALALTHEALAAADIAGALTIEGLFGSVVPFDKRLHDVRPHPGARATAAILRALLQKSRVVASHKHCGRVQDPYALRCIPAVHGTVRDALAHIRTTLLCEANSVTDNPIVFPHDNVLLSGGNFHGAPVAFAMDQLAIALTTLASISERRTEQLINPKAGELPVMGLTAHPGLHSGLMVAHTTAAALVSENKTLAHPASVDTIPTWAGQEDHVSMGMWAARKALQVAENTLHVVAIELLAACQALDLHEEWLEPGRGAAAAYRAVRQQIRAMPRDRVVAPDIVSIAKLIRTGNVRQAVEAVVGKVWE